jgi:hypothetical protein
MVKYLYHYSDKAYHILKSKRAQGVSEQELKVLENKNFTEKNKT